MFEDARLLLLGEAIVQKLLHLAQVLSQPEPRRVPTAKGVVLRCIHEVFETIGVSAQIIKHAPFAVEKFSACCISVYVWIVLSRNDHALKLLVLLTQLHNLILRSAELLFKSWLLASLALPLWAEAQRCKLFVPLLPFLRCVCLRVQPVTSVSLLSSLFALCWSLHALLVVKLVGPTLGTWQRCLIVAVLAGDRIGIEVICCSDLRFSTILNHLFKCNRVMRC